jgi:translocation and assembly module TamA
MQAVVVRSARGSVLALAMVLAVGTVHAQEVSASSPVGEGLRAGARPVPPPPPSVPLRSVEPVIPDADFNAAIPRLDPGDDAELARPLESIDAFERALSAPAMPDGQSPPLGDPALADGDAVEEVGDAPVRDAELAQPLPPLGQFQVEPVQFADAASDADDVQVPYRVQVNGLAEADTLSAANMADLFKDLSALGQGNGKAANAAMVSARLSEDSVLMQRILASEGWYDARVATRIERGAADAKQPLLAAIDVMPGNRYTLADIIVTAAPTVPPGLIRDNLALKVGEPIVAERVQGAEAQVAIALPENGYPFAEVGQRDILLDPATSDGVYTLPVTTGPRARFGDFSTDGDLAFDAAHAQVLARFRRGELYDSRKVDDLRQALVATGLFSTVSVEAQRTGQDAGDGTEYVTMQVHQDAGPPRTIAGTAGYGTGEGMRAEASWTHRNLFRPEGALIVSGVAGTKEQGAGVTFRRANAGRRDRTFEVQAEARHSKFDAFDAYTGRIAARMAYDSTPIWQKRLTWALGAEILATAEKDYNFARSANTRRTFYVAGITGQLGIDHSDSLLDPTKGFRLTTLIEPEGSLAGGFHPYLRARMDASAYYPVGDSIVVAGRVRLGTIQGADLRDIAPSRRLYSGGGGSVRGYGYLKLGPQDPNGDPIGGRSLNEAAAEVRYRFGNYGVVGFVDAGQSYAATTPKFSDLRIGAGIGGRFYTNFGPIRLDVATPINRRKGEGRFNIYVSIGQAF